MNRLSLQVMATLVWPVVALGANAPLTTQRETQVSAVCVTTLEGALSGRAARLTARIARNRARVPSVGITEELSSGTGDQWLTTLWQAAFVATQATDSSLLDFEFTLRVGGPIEGPSAGLLTASTLTALIRGKKVLPGTTVVGSVNPDGSAGPVSDVVLRLRAAAGAGLKRFGFPLGARQQADASGEVDLLVEGKKLGVEVKELASLDDAYLFLTGEALPRPAAANEADLELWPVELAALTRLTAQVRGEFDADFPRLEAALEGVDPKSANHWRELIERSRREAADFANSGDSVRAMVVWTSVLSITHLAQQEARLVPPLEARDRAAVFAQLKAQEDALPIERSKLRREIDARFPNTTRANDIYALDLLESVVTQGRALEAGAEAKALADLGTSEEDEKTFSRVARHYARALLLAVEELKNGQRFVALYASLPRLKKSLPPIDAARLAASYASAGAASRAYFKARLTSEGGFIAKDSTWLDLVGYGELLTTETDARSRLVLAARQTIYSAYLVNTYDSLGGQLDAKGVFSIRNSRALTTQLELARVRVLQSCGRALRETGSIPFPARMRFLNARAGREGSDRQKADTLADLWISNWWCELAVRDRK